ncbi:MAG: hypothetical protein JWO96_672 [Candidatus Saccharibacteria bacterium]|nr:hypothetical protein [Candidatus Saccharibacteria bacterium]
MITEEAIQVRSKWSRDRDLNPRPPPYHGGALPLSYHGPFQTCTIGLVSHDSAKVSTYSRAFSSKFCKLHCLQNL